MKRTITLGEERELAYAENRSQNPAKIRPIEGDKDPLAMHRFNVVSGDPSYITYADGSQILNILCLLTEAFKRWGYASAPYIAIAGKHGNPCGAAVDLRSPSAAIRKALAGDPVAVMGGEVITNFPIGEAESEELYAPQPENDHFFKTDIGRANWGLDIIFAPSFSEEAVELLGKREKRRLLENASLLSPRMTPDDIELKPVRGSYLEQAVPKFVLAPAALPYQPSGELMRFLMGNLGNMLIAWAVCWRASSNTVALAKENMLIGLGCGQQDRIACVRLCIDRATRAGHGTKGSFFASDAFFPYAVGSSLSSQEGMLLSKALDDLRMIDSGTKFKTPKEYFRVAAPLVAEVNRFDRREGPELLIDAGCIGGVVPFDGKNKEEVRKLFEEAGVSVAFLAPENRGFSKHA